MVPRFRPVPTLALLALVATACGKKKDEPTYGEAAARAIREGHAMQARGDMAAIANALTNYVSSGSDLPEASTMDELASYLEPTHLRRVPVHDPWGSAYHYATDGSSYTLRSAGKDLRMGTDDDIVMTDGQITKMPKGYTTFDGQ